VVWRNTRTKVIGELSTTYCQPSGHDGQVIQSYITVVKIAKPVGDSRVNDKWFTNPAKHMPGKPTTLHFADND
jgi:hypothetical protein